MTKSTEPPSLLSYQPAPILLELFLIQVTRDSEVLLAIYMYIWSLLRFAKFSVACNFSYMHYTDATANSVNKDTAINEQRRFLVTTHIFILTIAGFP